MYIDGSAVAGGPVVLARSGPNFEFVVAGSADGPAPSVFVGLTLLDHLRIPPADMLKPLGHLA